MLIIAFVLFISLCNRVISEPQLLMIQEVFRHGARFPIFISPKDNSDLADKYSSAGELTSQGKNMQYLLGKVLYRKYWDQLFPNTPYQNSYNNTQFYVKSTDVNRTIESAQSQLFAVLQRLPALQLKETDYQYSLPAWAGIEDNVSGSWDVFKGGPAFHPIPIHVEKKGADLCDEGDFLRNYDVQNCPNQKYWILSNHATKQYKQVQSNEHVIKAIQALSKQLGQEVQFDQVYKWKDSQICLQFLGQKYLQIFDHPHYASIFDFIEVYSMYKTLYSEPQQIKAVSTNFIKRTLSNIRGKIDGGYTPKITIYSAHDTTLGMVLAALNMTNSECIIEHYLKGVNNSETCVWKFPIFSSNLIFEVWSNEEQHPGHRTSSPTLSSGQDAFIKIRYEGQYRRIPVCRYQIECKLSELEAWADDFMVASVSEACGLHPVDKTFYSIIIILLIALVVAIFNLSYLKYKQSQQNKQSSLTEAENKDRYIEQVDEKNLQPIELHK